MFPQVCGELRDHEVHVRLINKTRTLLSTSSFFFKFGYVAYVNGQRKGRVLERPFSMGESIAREEEIIESLDSSMDSDLPMLDVEEEIRLAFDLKKTLEDDDSQGSDHMKELGLQR